ncbi:TPA: replication-associated recombination protein A [Candidatus Gastranaerophilales bacterium HUM_6]|jgi:putative ATPase|nr:replication-associated recombination protein A [bacterium]MEE0495299.1 replication-associated recombination protein A [Cyanobacteriota bacterium]CDE93233.1 aAA ATPase central domain protein [Fusobacterium sp. CAG:815]DAA93236.1 MAG TPA: replication-associated recombination protein A [Candidatus Gastranaerophilales bacterium HUM_6]DAA93499.1 MAG TPA: replication-associated recombination protein A [Candidatus Gastranaerophilales bacterium HUM_7]DAB02769.1 MAG TPA: replication-associated recom
MNNLFTELENQNKQIPLAEILRPKTIEDFLGQSNVISPNSPILNLLKTNRLFSMIFWGTPGCGKTTLARLIATKTNANFIEISAVTSGVKDIKDAVEKAKESLRAGQKTILFIDEIHRYSKTQQDALLPHLENGTLFLIGSTTENPSFQVVPALLSRVQVVRLNPINDESMAKIIKKGFSYLATHYTLMECESGVLDFIINLARGDARYALNIVENAYFASDLKDNKRILTVKTIEEICQQRNTRYSQQEHYDCASAFQKSLRGGDADAAIYYLAKMIVAGEDPRFIARRLITCASEDIGNADPNALNIALNAYKAVELLGLPEGRIPLAQAVIYVARAKKSNESVCAIDSALSDISAGLDFAPPMHLRDAHYKDASKYGFGVGYVYTPDNPDYDQQFMPDELLGKKYTQQ